LTKEITKTKRSPLNVLILGDGVETDLYINFCKDLSSQLPDQYKVIFRPHPMEKNSLNTYSNSFLIGLEIDFSADIYDTLSNSYAVISEVSTASFEAAGISQKSLLWRTAKSQFAYPSSPLTGFYDISDLIQKLMDPDAGNMNQVAVEEIWASNWRDRFSSFIKTILDQNR
jgi:CDP-glycerol glycerophosphotransferase (TagB/SpsB family)